MLKFTITYKGEEFTRQIKTSFDDVTNKDLHTIPSEKPRELIKHFSDLTAEEVKRLSANQVNTLVDLLDFIYEEPTLLPIEKEIDVAREAWSKIEQAKARLKDFKIYKHSFEIAEIYFGEEIWSWEMGKIYSQTAQIVNSINLFLNRYKDLYQDKGYTEEELEAGVEALESFGVGAIRHGLASGDITKFEQIEKTDAETVYFTLLYNKAVAMYQEELSKIKQRSNVNSQPNS